MEQAIISGVAHDRSEAKVTVVGVPDKPGQAAVLLRELAAAEINIDMIVQNVSTRGTGRADVSFTIPTSDGATALTALRRVQPSSGSRSCSTTTTSGSCRSSARGCVPILECPQRSSPRSPTPASTSR